jgi:hypothetical protein
VRPKDSDYTQALAEMRANVAAYMAGRFNEINLCGRRSLAAEVQIDDADHACYRNKGHTGNHMCSCEQTWPQVVSKAASRSAVRRA